MLDLRKYTNADQLLHRKHKNDTSDTVRCPKCRSDNVGSCYRGKDYVTKTCYECGFAMHGEPEGVFITWNELLDNMGPYC